MADEDGASRTNADDARHPDVMSRDPTQSANRKCSSVDVGRRTRAGSGRYEGCFRFASSGSPTVSLAVAPFSDCRAKFASASGGDFELLNSASHAATMYRPVGISGCEPPQPHFSPYPAATRTPSPASIGDTRYLPATRLNTSLMGVSLPLWSITTTSMVMVLPSASIRLTPLVLIWPFTLAMTLTA